MTIAAGKRRETDAMSSMLRRNDLVSTSGLCPLALLLALVPDSARGATLAVTNCDDSGPGSLRQVIAGAASGDTVDMSALACRRIELTSGPIQIAQEHLSLLGGPPGLVKLDAAHRSSVLRHTGRGWLRIKRLNIADGLLDSGNATAEGGCLYSQGNVELVNSKVHGCRAEGGRAYGGGIFAFGRVKLNHTWVTGNTAAGGLCWRDFHLWRLDHLA